MAVQAVSAAATALSAAGTIVLAFLTFRSVRATRGIAQSNEQMVKESRESREAQERANHETIEELRAEREARERPRVRVDIDYDHRPWLYVVVRNFGGGPATRVRFSFTPELVTPASASPASQGTILLSQRLRMFSRGIDFLPAGAEIPVWWGASELIINHFYEKKMDRHGIRVEIFYQSDDGQNYEERVIINPVDMEEVLRFHPPNLSQLVGPLTKAAERIEKAIDNQGFVKIKTATERERELRERLDRMTGESAQEAAREAERQREERNREIRERSEGADPQET